MNPLFISVDASESVNRQPAILLVDVSGSTGSQFESGQTVFDKMMNVCVTLPYQDFHIIFWSSNVTVHDMIIHGQTSLRQMFMLQRGRNSGYTYPDIGFSAINPSWINNKEPTHVYLVTDGMIEGSVPKEVFKNRLRDAIRQFFTQFNNIHLHIITVEAKVIDTSKMEGVNNIAGGDVLDVFRQNNLTDRITEYVMYSQNHQNGFNHISRVIAPPGHIPFGNQYLSELRVGEFIRFLMDHIRTLTTEDTIIALIQNLTTSIKYLVNDKPQRMVQDIIDTFCDLFHPVTHIVDQMIVRMMMTDSVRSELRGQALTYTEYRARVRQLFKLANDLLIGNSKDAMAIGRNFMTLPFLRKIIIGNSNMITERFEHFNRSSVKIDNVIIPVIPFISNPQTEIVEQCIRQFTRAIISRQYSVEVQDDSIIHIVLGIVLNVVLSDTSEEIKNAYRNLGFIMLRKKRLNSSITELDNIKNGSLPIPNSGNTDLLFGYIHRVSQILGANVRPMTLWYAFCSALNDQELLTKQYIHCADDVRHDCGDVPVLQRMRELIAPIQIVEIPAESQLEYTCIITMENMEHTGGFKISPHISPSGQHCSPLYVLSETGMDGLLRANRQCPICYSQLVREQFERVGPKPNIGANIFPPDTQQIFGNYDQPAVAAVPPVSAVPQPIGAFPPAGAVPVPLRNQLRFLIVMNGTVGSGKSTISRMIQERVIALGGFCVNEGTDKYCKNGMRVQQASQYVNAELTKCLTSQNNIVVAIVDTCGERCQGKKLFGVDLQLFKRIDVYPNLIRTNAVGYMSWSLRNVLQRHRPLDVDNYNLNPETVPIDVCVRVMNEKANKLFRFQPITVHGNKEQIIAEINDRATQYQQFLDANMPLDRQVDELMQKLH